jgi:rhodanese-related sulfurtransferase
MKSITVEDLKEKRESEAEFVLLDVREPSEFAAGAIAGSVNIPMGQVERRLRELPKDREIIVICHSGARSASITSTLNRLGYKNAVNVTGGIAAWGRRIDPQVSAGGPSLSALWKGIFGSRRPS